MARMRHTRRSGASEAGVVDRLRSLVDLAESDPAKFRAECAVTASKLGVGVERVYQTLERDPRVGQAIREALANEVISRAAKFARRALGL